MYSLHPAPRRFIQGKQKDKQMHMCHPEERRTDFVPNRTRELFSSSGCNGKSWCAAKSWSLQFLTFPLSAWVLEFLLYVFST